MQLFRKVKQVSRARGSVPDFTRPYAARLRCVGKNNRFQQGPFVADKPSSSRRDFLYVATAASGVVGAGVAVWPFLDQMNPSSGVLAQASEEIDLSTIPPGMQAVYSWRGHPLAIRHRTPKEIAEARAVELSALIDPKARNAMLAEDAPATDANRVVRPEWLVVTGVCPHLGCTPTPSLAQSPQGAYGGWLCHCHGSQFDTAGRVRTGPAQENLFVPPYSFLSDSKIKVG